MIFALKFLVLPVRSDLHRIEHRPWLWRIKKELITLHTVTVYNRISHNIKTDTSCATNTTLLLYCELTYYQPLIILRT